MTEDLMNTQTGGTGETIQLQPEVKSNPEQFDVKINPPVDSEPSAPAQTATVPTQEEAIIEPTLNNEQASVETKVEEQVGGAPNVEVEETEKGVPQVTAEVGTEVPLSDNDYSVFSSEKIGIDRSESPTILDLSGYTIDGDAQATYINESSEIIDGIPTTEEQPEEQIDLSTFTIDGDPQSGNLETKERIESVRSQYKDTPIEIKDNGKVSVKSKKEKPEEPKIDGELYTYKGRPGVMYKKKGKGDWYIDINNTGDFVKIERNAKSRIAELERNAVKVSSQKSKVVNKADKVIQNRFGNITDFNQNQLLTAGGDAVITKGLNFSQLTKSNEPTKSDRYTNSGQVNFNYDPNYANATKEQRALIDASKGKPDGYYRFPNSDALFQKKDGEWLKDPSGKGKKFFPLLHGEVEEREKALEAKAVKTNLDLANNIVSTFKPIKIQAIKSADDLLKNVGKAPQVSDLIENANNVNSFEEAKNFADKDLITMFAKNNTLSGDQIQNLLEQQKQVKEIIGDGKFDDLKAKAVGEVLNDSREFFEQSKLINEKINEAYSKDMSLDRLALEEKRKDLDRALNTYSKMNDFQTYTYDTFKSTLKMADFIQDAIDDGKMLRDRENGGYKFSTNITETERKYYEGTLAKYLKEYNNIQGEKFATLNGEISESKDKLRSNLDNISQIKERLNNVDEGSEEYKDLYSKWYGLKQENKTLEKEIKDKTSLKSTVFLTEPKKAAASINTTESVKNIFNAIPKELSPKQKFDLFYQQLQKKNDQIAKSNEISENVYGQFKRAAVDLLDWGGYFSLSNEEKEWLKNKETLNQLAPLYFNNDSGFSQSSGGFYESFMNGAASFLFPKTSKADNYFSQSEAAGKIMQELEKEGFTKDDVVDDNYLTALKEKQNVDFWSAEQFGNMTGTTAGIIVPLIATRKIGSSAFKVANKVEGLISKTKNLEKAATYIKRADNIFESTLKSTRYGKYLYEPIKTGLQFETAGKVFGSTNDELYFLSGFAGGLASEGFAAVVSKLPTDRAYSLVKSVFGGKTQQAINLMKKAGEANVKGATEVVEEFGNELANIYTDELRDKGFFDAVKDQFGDLDYVEEFFLSTYMMGIGMGVGSMKSTKKAFDALPKEKKDKINKILDTVKDDIDFADDKVDEYVDEQEEQVQKEKSFDKEPQKEIKTNDLGELEFDAESIKEASEGRPSVVAESKEEPSSFTEPIDFDKLEEYDKENQQGIPGEERKGEELVEAKPVAESGQETPSPSGVVQEEQKIDLTSKSLDDLENRYSELEGSREENERKEFIEIENELEKREWESVLNAPLSEVNNILNDLKKKEFGTFIDRSDISQSRAVVEKYSSEVDKREAVKDFKDAFFGNPSNWYADALKLRESTRAYLEQGGSFKDLLGSVQKEFKSDGFTEQDAANVINNKLNEVKNKFNKDKFTPSSTKVEATTPEATMFSEAADIKKIRNKQQRDIAETAFQEKHGVSHKKVSNINTNFATIVKNLEKNNLIEKEC